MVKKLPTKDDLRAQLERATRDYLADGGEVNEVPRGVSGSDPMKADSFRSSRVFNQPSTPRTFVPEVIAAIEARRAQRPKKRPAKKRSRLPQKRRRTIYDDFGEPLRKVWVDE